MSGNGPERGGGRDESSPGSTSTPLDPGPDPQSLAPMDFSTFVLSLGSSAMVHLGKIPSPDAQSADAGRIDLAAAKQIIDILGMLEEKTRGNLDDPEERLLQSLLYDLRIEFVDAQKRGS
jgi:hypothetical protein